MANPKSWADISNDDIALIRQARGAQVPANFFQTSPYMNLSRDDMEYIARLRGREYNPKFGPSNNLRGDDIDFIRQMRAQGVSQPQQFANSGSPYVGGPYWTQQNFTNEGSPYVGQPTNETPAPALSAAVTEPRNEAILNRLEGARRSKPYPGLTRGLDPSLPSYQDQGPIDYATMNTTSPSGVYPFTAGVAAAASVPEQQNGIKLFQKNVRAALGLPPVSDNKGILTSPQIGTPAANAAQSQPALDPMIDTRAMENGYGVPLSAMDTRGSENGYGVPIAALDTRASENGSGAMPKAARKSAPATDTATQPAAGTAALFYLDDGSGALRPFLSKDGSTPNIPGVTAIRDDTFNPNAGALARFIRGVF